MKKAILKLKGYINWVITQSWFFSVSLFLGLILTGNVESARDFFATLVLCLVFWIVDFLFLKKAITKIFMELLNHYKKRTTEFKQK